MAKKPSRRVVGYRVTTYADSASRTPLDVREFWPAANPKAMGDASDYATRQRGGTGGRPLRHVAIDFIWEDV